MIRFVVVTGVLGMLAGCPPAEDDCARQVRLMRQTALARVHGLTADDDIKAQAERAIEVAHCSTDPKAQELARTHAQALAARLEGRGNSSDLLALGRNIPGPTGEQIRQRSEKGTGGVRAVLEQLADDSEKEAQLPEHPESGFFASLWQNRAFPVADDSRACVTFSAPGESCVVLVPGAKRPSGMLHANLVRGETNLPMHGDSPVVNWSVQRAAPVTFCTRGPWAAGDRLQLKQENTIVVNVELSPDAEARAAGALRAMLAAGIVDKSACADVKTARGRAICALLER